MSDVAVGPATVVHLDGSGASATDVGGKGAQLDELVAGGFAVPTTAVVTTAAYRNTLAGSEPLEALVDRLERDVETVPTDAEIDAAFLAVPLPAPLQAEIIDTARAVADGGPVAVRSSATAEDLGEASFAGQYRSLLDVGPGDEVVDAVRLVWASLWHAAPRAYRRHVAGGAHVEPSMAVVIMAMVPAVSAGVVFTVDPGGRPGAMRIEAVEGLGEELVSGRRTPRAVVLARSGSDAPDEPFPAVRDRALAVERWFARPQDIEWAWDGDTVWIVQSRAITTTPSGSVGAEDAASGRRHTTAGIGEMVPGVLPPLVWDVARPLLEEAFRALFDDLGALPADLGPERSFVRQVRGRAVLDVDTLAEVAERLPGGSPELLEHQLFGASGERAPLDDDSAERSLRGFAHAVRVMRSRRRARLDAATCIEAADDLLDQLPPLADLDDDALLMLRSRVLDLAARAMAAEVAVAASAVAAHGLVEQMLERYLGADEAVRWARRVTTPPLSGLARAARRRRRDLEEAGVDVASLGRSWATAREALVASGSGHLAEAIEELMRRSGSRSVVAGPAWIEQPDALWAIVASAPTESLGTSVDEDRTALLELLAARPGWRRTRLLTGQLVDVRRHIIERHVTDAVELLAEREAAKSAVLALGGVLRRLHLVVGHRLAAAGSLDAAAEVDLLTGRELIAAVRGEVPGRPEREGRRRRIEEWRSGPELPISFRGDPTTALANVPTGDRFDGWAASAGRFTGRAVVLDAPDAEAVDATSVLVASSTDAAWLPVFLACGAVVVERGGPLSHAAIVARELGLPAVTNVPGFVEAVRDHPVSVTVDGDVGVVIVHRPAPGREPSERRCRGE